MAPQRDAIIIGSGVNSLACAVHLAHRGWRVVVYEQAATPGGAVKCGAYTLPGLRHDWGAMNLSLFAGSPFFAEYGGALAGHGLEFAPVAKCFASVFDDGTWLGIGTDAQANTARLNAENADDAKAWQALAAAFPQEAEDIFAILGSPMQKRAFARIGWKLARKRGLRGSADFARFMTMSPRAWLDQTFTSDKVKALLGVWGMHLDFAPDIAGGAVFPYLEGMANQAFGMVLGKGGADTIVHAMVKLIEAKGGKVICDTPVTHILTDEGRTLGVTLANGTDVHAGTVIANVAPSALARMIGGSGHKSYDEGLTKFAHAPGTMMIHAALDGLPDWRAGTQLQDFAYVHIAPSLDQMARTYQQARAGLLPDQPVIVVGQPTTIDPSRSTDGTHALWIQVRMAPATINGDAKGQITATDWAQAADPFADRILDIIDTHAPGIRSKIKGQRIVTPPELEHDNPNLVGGDQVCGSHHLSQHFLNRPMPGYADGSTPINNLWHTGAAVWPGGGTGVGPGWMLAQKLANK